MAETFSFDIVSKTDAQEVLNAVDQTNRQLSQRFDLKGSGSNAEWKQEDQEIVLRSADEYTLKSVIEILKSKLVKRSISLKVLSFQDVQPATNGTVRQTISIQQGISKDKARDIVKDIKAGKMKVQAQIMEDQVRVSGRKKDELQDVINQLKQKDYGIHMDFCNYR